jgi:hypothetical protein
MTRKQGQNLDWFIAADVAKFRSRDPKVKVVSGSPISLHGAKSAQVRYFPGDGFGNHEAVAYIAEARVFVVFVLTTRTETTYRTSLVPFAEIVKSYRFLFSQVEINTGEFNRAKWAAQQNLRTPEGKAYDAESGKDFQNNYAVALTNCFKTLHDPDPSDFDLLARLDRDGKPLEILLRPDTNIAQCLRKAVAHGRFPRPPRGDYWIIVQMNIAGKDSQLPN